MKQVNITYREAYQELLTVAKWTVQMLDQNAITYAGNTITSIGFDDFYDWSTAVRAAVALSEIADDSPQQIKKTHADVQLPQLKGNGQLLQPCAL